MWYKYYYSWPIFFAEYMLELLHIEESEVPKMCLDLYREYGTTMAGLKVWRFGIALIFLFIILLKCWFTVNDIIPVSLYNLKRNPFFYSCFLQLEREKQLKDKKHDVTERDRKKKNEL